MTSLRKRETDGSPAPADLPAPEEWRSLRRLDAGLAYAGLGARVVFYVLLFLWAARSGVGAAFLQGFIAADILTWAVFAVFDWSFRGMQVTVGGVAQAVLVLLYLNRETLFDISMDPESLGLSFLAFLLFAVVKGVAWQVEHTLDVTGVREPS